MTLKRLLAYRKSTTIRVAIIGNTLLMLLFTSPDIIVNAIHVFINDTVIDTYITKLQSLLPLLVALGVIKGRIDTDDKPYISHRD